MLEVSKLIETLQSLPPNTAILKNNVGNPLVIDISSKKSLGYVDLIDGTWNPWEPAVEAAMET